MSASSLNSSLNPVVGALSNQIFISNVQISQAHNTVTGGTAQSVAGVVLEGVTFTQAAGLATVGGTITLGATVASQSNQALIYETIAPAPVVTSIAPFATTISAGATATVQVGVGAVQFSQFTGGTQTVTLASISITETGALATDLSTTVSPDGSVANTFAASSGINVTVTSAALSDPAVADIEFISNNGATAAFDGTVANFAGGTATFTLTNAQVTYTGTTLVQLAYSGTTGISPALAGTVSVAFQHRRQQPGCSWHCFGCHSGDQPWWSEYANRLGEQWFRDRASRLMSASTTLARCLRQRRSS